MMHRKLVAVAAAVAFTAAAVGCSTDKGTGSSGGSPGGKAAVDTLNMTASAAAPTFVKNWNRFSPADKKSPATNLLYEPLIRIDHLAAKKPEPWLAESFEWSPDGKTLTFKLRTDVKWSDGTPFTAKDVKFTFEAPKSNPKLTQNSLGFKSIATPDDHTVVVSYDDVAYQKLASYGDERIVPQHIWSQQNLETWTNPDPIGTGPAKLTKFSPQQITFDWRDDYWGGKSKGVKHINIKPFADPQVGKAMMLNGQLDWSTMSWQDADKQFVAKNPTTNHYWTYPTGGDEGLNFNVAKPPLDDVHVRRALYAAIDPEKLLKLNVTGQSPTNATGYDAKVYGELLAPEYKDKPHTQDLATAKAELAKASYTVDASGNLSKGGKAYPLTMKPVVEYSNWSAWGLGLAEQWRTGLGVSVKVVPTPEDQLWGQMAKGDYNIALDWQAGGNTPWAGYDGVLNSANGAPLGQEASTNYTRWQDKTTDDLLAKWRVSNDAAKQKEYAAALQKIVVDNVPFAPLFTAAWFIEVNSTRWSGWPDPASAEYVPHSVLGPETILTIQNLTPAK
jgi:peptide/nickel transport system substrate-binding protein